MASQRPDRIVEPPDSDRPFLPEAVFSEDVVMVTGGSSGMGRGMALAFAQGGAKLAIVGRDIEKARAVVAEIEAMGETALAIAADVRHAAQVAAAFDAAEAELGPVSILANNAGGNFPALAEALSTNAWNAITQIAVDGTFLCSSEFARRCIARGAPGAIVNNSAQYIWTGFPGDAHSAAAKAAIATLTRALARDWRPSGIRVNCVAAGFFPHAASTNGEDPGAVEKLGRMIPAGRTGRMQEFGWAGAFLCSPFASAITGQVMMIDGGESLRRALMSPDFVAPNHRSNLWGYSE
ncbi:MAG: short-chain dehydrogenase [Hyphomonas sp.]|uniref:SDR family oxidoreductase n=1 Tax=Hyphomonas sp. TaxID=87 RepID=UPI0025BA4F2B|nr:SDR family oxidoreductase [Hyphomonas sp.]MBA4340278.1 short-chain dehydrogenase [Hyphomonas sp.]